MKSILLATTASIMLAGYSANLAVNEPSPEQKEEIEQFSQQEQYELQMKKDLSNLMLKYNFEKEQ